MSEYADMAHPKTGRAKRSQLTVTVPPELARHVEDLATLSGLTKSAVVGRILEFDRDKREDALRREGYNERSGG